MSNLPKSIEKEIIGLIKCYSSGTEILFGNGSPTEEPSGPAVYFDVDTGDVYAYEDGAWVLKMTLVLGEDTTPPALTSAIVQNSNPNRIVLDYNENINGSIIPSNSDYTVPGKTVTGVSITGDKVYVTVSVAFLPGDVITISYTSGVNKIQDNSGNIAPDFTNQSVTNNVTGDVTPPTLTSAVVEDADPDTVVLDYNETLNDTIVPSTSDYTIAGKTISSVDIVGDKVYIVVTVPFVNGNVITISYVPGTNKVQDLAGNLAASLTNQSVTNNVAPVDTTPPVISSAVVENSNPSRLTLDYNENLNTGSVPSGSDFTISPSKTISNVTVSGDKVHLDVSVPFVNGNVITVSYTGGVNKIQDVAGNNASNLVNYSVTNNVLPSDVTAPTLSSATVFNSNPSQIVLDYNENLDTGSVPATTDFTTSPSKTISSTSITGDKVYINTSTPFDAGDVITINYTGGVNKIQDTAGNDAANLVSQAVTNSIIDPVEPPEETYIIVQVGQSQIPGRAAPDVVNEVIPIAGNFEYVPSTNTLKALEDPTGESYSIAMDRSMNPSLGNQFVSLTGKAVIILPKGKGNTSIDEWNDTDGSTWTSVVEDLQALRDYCTANSITVIKVFVHWLQGENDASVMTTQEYYGKLNILFNNMISELGVENIFMTRIGFDPNYATKEESEEIMLAQKRINFSRDEVITDSYAPCTFTEGNGKMKADGVHYTVLGLNEVGVDVAQAMFELIDNNEKVILTELDSDLTDPDFDDIYNMRSLQTGINRTNYNEMWGRNNLTKAGSGTGTFDGKNGLTNISGSMELNPATVRTLSNSHDWTVEATFSMSETESMFINGTNSNWTEHYLWITSTNSISLRGDGVTKGVVLTGVDFSQMTNLALVYTTSDSTLRIYVNGGLKETVTDWAFTTWKLESFLRGYGNSPSITFGGDVQRIRVVKRALNTYEFDNTFLNQTEAVIDLSFAFNNSIAEDNGIVGTSFYDMTDNPASPNYDTDFLDLNSDGYVRLDETQLLDNNFTVGWTGTRVDKDNDDFMTGKSSTGADGGYDRRIAWSADFLYIDGVTFNLGTTGGGALSIDSELEHTYKVVYDKTASTLALYVDGVLEETKTSTALTNGLAINIIGAGHTNDTYGYKGKIKDFEIKNYI